MVARQNGADAVDLVLAGQLDALRCYLDGEVALTAVAAEHGVALRTARRWVARLRASGPAGLERKPRSDTGRRRLAPDLVILVEGLALTRPRLSIATIHRRAREVARTRGWPVASYASVHAIVTGLDPALVTLALDGDTAFRDRYEIINRHRAERPNATWQADHTQLDILIRDADGAEVRPWLTSVLDDHSRAIAGYMVFLGAPLALNTELLPELPGHLQDGKQGSVPGLSLTELDAAICAFIVGSYNIRVHDEIGVAPVEAWRGAGWLPRLPDSLDALDGLLIMVGKPRVVRRDGILFEGLRYFDPRLAAYVGEAVTVRYDPRDLSEIRIFHRMHLNRSRQNGAVRLRLRQGCDRAEVAYRYLRMERGTASVLYYRKKSYHCWCIKNRILLDKIFE